MTPQTQIAPGLDDIEALARRAWRRIPSALRSRVAEVVIQVTDFPDEETMQEMELRSPFDILGLYRGVSLDQRASGDLRGDVDMIFLYRRPILDYWVESGEGLERLVRHVLIHEVGHHFGFSDADMAAIEAAADDAA